MWGLFDGFFKRRAAQRHPESVGFDATWGTETAAFDYDNYEPTLPSIVDQALDALDVDPAGWSFVDLGSGKGRVVLQASRRPFKRVIGVEYGGDLHDVAERNLSAFEDRGGRVAPVFLLHGDAARQPLPEGPLVLYLYNPFLADVLTAVLRRAMRPELRVIYVNPLDAAVVESFDLVEIARGGGPFPWWWRIWRAPG